MSKSTETSGPSGGKTRTVTVSEVKGGTNQGATSFAAKVVGLSPVPLRNAFLIAFKDTRLNVFPEVIGAQPIALRRTRSRTGGYEEDRAVGRSEKNFDGNLDDLFLSAMVQFGLLRTVVSGVRLREANELSEGREEGDRRDVGPGLRRREALGTFVEEVCERTVVTLAEEIGFTNGFVGKGGLEGEGRGRR